MIIILNSGASSSFIIYLYLFIYHLTRATSIRYRSLQMDIPPFQSYISVVEPGLARVFVSGEGRRNTSLSLRVKQLRLFPLIRSRFLNIGTEKNLIDKRVSIYIRCELSTM